MKFNILVVDDSSCMRKVLRKSITMCRIGEVNFFEAENGQEALECLKKEWIDLVFTDLNMPVMNGLDFVKTLRQDEDHIKNIPVIVVTSDTNVDNTNKVKANNVNGIIYKPFRPEDMRMLLINLLDLEDKEDDEDTDFEGCDF
jgi:two-component system chemotaxis response regulator CheY